MVELKSKKIELTFLGTGTSQGVPLIGCDCPVCDSTDERDARLRSSVLIHTAEKNIVIDAGPDFRQQMLMNNIHSLRAILLTHEHVDHMFGLDDIRPFNWIQKRPMDIYAEKRVEKAIKRIFDYVFSGSKYPGIPKMNLHRIENSMFNIDDIVITPIRALHHKLPVLGYRFGKLAYLTDVNFIPEEEKEKLKGLDVLVINALRREDHISHFNFEQAVAISSELNPTRTYLTHFSHAMGKHNDVEKELPDNIFVAYDGLKIESKY